MSGPSKETLVHSSTSVEAPISPPEPPIVPSSPAPPVFTVPLVQTVSGADEKALVLYRPLNQPLYPGGPPTGSSELPIKVHAAGYLAAIKGTDNNGLCSDADHPSSAFANSSSDTLCGAGLFEGSPFYFLIGRKGFTTVGGGWEGYSLAWPGFNTFPVTIPHPLLSFYDKSLEEVQVGDCI